MKKNDELLSMLIALHRETANLREDLNKKLDDFVTHEDLNRVINEYQKHNPWKVATITIVCFILFSVILTFLS